MKPARAVLSVCIALTFLLCAAWGATGHKVVAQIAYGHLSPKAKAEVDKLLAGSTLAEFSVWADQIKNDPTWKWTKPWHYADMPEGAAEFKMDRDCPDEGCVVKGIERYAAVLRNDAAPQEDRVQALKFLTHYVGDLHQPLHVGNKADKGGNSIEVQLFSRKANLHSVWDDGIIKRTGMDYPAYASHLEAKLTPENRKAFTAVMDPSAWATESHRLAQASAYKNAKGETIKSGDTLGADYADANQKVIDEQLTRAGLRLAEMLNKIFESATVPSTPAAPAAPVKPSEAPKAPAAPQPFAKFVGSKHSEVYHYPGCSVCRSIKPENRVEYSEAPEGKRLHKGCPQ